MSPSGAEVIRQIKQQIEEVDPAEVSEHLGNGIVVVDVRVILYCASGQRSAFGAHALSELLGYTNVASMTGGITLWKDRGYKVEVPKVLTPEQKERYGRHLLLPEVGADGQAKLLDAKVLLL